MVEALVDEVWRDRAFYEASGGGVTASGGEPTFQREFLEAFARASVERGLSVGLQTAGTFSWEALQATLRTFAFIQLDLKVLDRRRHVELTGGDNAVILENARRLVAGGYPVEFRMPVVPGHNDDVDNLERTAAFLGSLGHPRLTLLEYHRLGESRLARLGFPLAPLDILPAQAGPSRARAASHLERLGLEVRSVG